MEKLSHSEVEIMVIDWLLTQNYTRVRIPVNSWRPDLVFLGPDKVFVSVYEIKPELISYHELRQGLMQCLEGLVNGCKSYLVISNSYIRRLDKYIPFLPKLGIITYTSDKEITLVNDSEELHCDRGISTNARPYMEERIHDVSFIEPAHFTRKKRGRPGTAVRVKDFVYTRKGKIIRVPSYSRKRRSKK